MQPYRVLIVDDDPAVAGMLQMIVEEYGLGTVVGTAADGPGGEAAALRLRPEIVLIDLLMPGQDGLVTMRRLRDQGFAGTFVMISQVTDKDLVARAYQEGVEFFIHKPLHLTEILAVLRRVTEGLQMRQTLQSIRASLAPLERPAPPPGAAAGKAGAERVRVAARRVLADLGILGEAGAADLTALALLPRFRGHPAPGDFDLATVYAALSEHYRQGGDTRAPGPKAIEQRIRRAAAAALSHLAAIGLEDFGNPRFERLAPTFFDFTEVRAEMNRLRRGGGAPGRINLKKFIDAFLHEVESYAGEEG